MANRNLHQHQCGRKLFREGSDPEFRFRRVRSVRLYVRVAYTPLVKNLAVLGDQYGAIEITTLVIPGNELVDLGSFSRRRVRRGNEKTAENSKDEGTSPSRIHDRENM